MSFHDPKKMNFLQLWYYKYKVNTGAIAMTPAEEMIVNSMIVVSIFLFVRYTYVFTNQIINFLF